MTLLRSTLFNAWFFLSTIGLGIVGLGVRWFAPHRALWLATLWAKAVIGGAQVICGIRAEVTGREYLPDGPALIASQHQSAFDTFIWLLLVPKAAYVFKAELARIPLVGPLLVPAGQIALDRGASFAAIRSLLRGSDRAKDEGRQIVIFPEGTRVEHGVDAEIRPGVAAVAARTGLAVIPVATDSGRRWGRRAFRKQAGVVHVMIGPPIPPGLSQQQFLHALRDSWRSLHARQQLVDNPVEQTVARSPA